MTREQKHKLGMLMLDRVAQIIEFYDEIAKDLAIDGLSEYEAQKQLKSWCKLVATGNQYNTILGDHRKGSK
jgi:hypothetical protein